MQPKTVRLSYSLSLSVLPDFISQDYRLGFPATFKHNSNRLIGTVSLISFRLPPDFTNRCKLVRDQLSIFFGKGYR